MPAMIFLQSSDNEIFKVRLNTAKKSRTIRHMVELLNADERYQEMVAEFKSKQQTEAVIVPAADVVVEDKENDSNGANNDQGAEAMDVEKEKEGAAAKPEEKKAEEDLAEEFIITQEPVPLAKVEGNVLSKVLEWCKEHESDPDPPEEINYAEARTDDIPPFDIELLKVDQMMLYNILIAANYLDIRGLVNVCCKTIANMIKGKTAEQIRQTFGIENDLTPEEEEQIRKENESII